MIASIDAVEEGFVHVHDENSLDELFIRSKNAPVALFIHSTRCPISAAAYEEMRPMRSMSRSSSCRETSG